MGKGNSKTFFRIIIALVLLIFIGVGLISFGLLIEKQSELATVHSSNLELSQEIHSSNNEIKELEEKIEILQNKQKKMDSLNADYVQRIDRLYSEIKISRNNDNPIDEFFDSHEIISYANLAFRHHAALYMHSWEQEIDHAYDVLSELGHISIRNDIIESNDLIKEYAEKERLISMAVNASDVFGDELGRVEDSESVYYGTIAPLIGSIEKAEIFKEQTLKIHEYIKDIGEEIEYVFDGTALIEDNKELFIDESFLDDYYKISKLNDRYKLVLLDDEGGIVHEEVATREPQVEIINYYTLKIFFSTGSPLNYTYFYDVVNSEISEIYYNAMLVEDDRIIYMKDGKLIVTNIFNNWREDVEITRDWSPTADAISAIIDVEILDYNVLRVSYYMGDGFEEITEYVDLK